MNGRDLLDSNVDDLYAAKLSLKGSQHMVSMTKLLSALRQLKIKSKNIVSDKIKAAYDSDVSQMDLRRIMNKRYYLSLQKQQGRRLSRSKKTSEARHLHFHFEINSPLTAKIARRSRTKFNTPR